MNNLVVLDVEERKSEDFDRVERFQALQAGTYWRFTGSGDKQESKNMLDALRGWSNGGAKDEQTPVGMVLLLAAIDLFDGKPHTVHLAPHPLLVKRWGNTALLIDDFLNNWQFAPDGEQVRERELAALQMEVAVVQAELIEGQTNPAMMTPAVAAAVESWEGKKAEARVKEAPGAASVSTAVSQRDPNRPVSTNVGDVITNRMSAADIDQIGHMAERQAVVAETQSKWLTDRVSAIGEKIGAMTPFFQERSQVALAKTAEVRKYAADLMAGIASLDLYTGRGVEVETISKGSAAPMGQPLTLFQAKRYMDEELAVFADVDDEFDVTKTSEFIEQLKTDPRLRDQIFPAKRCVVSMAIRRDAVRYENLNVFEAAARNEMNQLVFLLVRNGDNVYCVRSKTPSHEMSARLFPTKDEFDAIFRGVDGSRINFDDLKFTNKARESEDLSLHYRRFLILLCGLEHRLGLLGPFPDDQAQSLSFISQEFQAKWMRFVADDDALTAISSTSRPATVWDFVRERNAHLQSGSRVLAFYPDLLTSKTAPSTHKLIYGRDYAREEELARPVGANGKHVRHGTHVVYKDGAELCIDVRVERQGYGDYVQPEFNARVSLTQAKHHVGEMAYLCLDTVRADDLDWYICDRRSRVHHTGFIRLFKRTVAEIRAEEALEAPARAYLTSAVEASGLAVSDGAVALVAESIRGWRCANRGAPLPPVVDKSAFNTILSLAYSLGRKADDYAQMLEQYALSASYVPLKAVLTGANKLALYVEVSPAERDERLMTWRWVKRINIAVLKTKLTETTSKLVWMTGAPDAKETKIKTWPELAGWINEKPEPFTPRAMAATLAVVDQSLPNAIEHFDGRGAGLAMGFYARLASHMERRMRSGSGSVKNAPLSIPIGAFVSPRGKVDGIQKPDELAYIVATAHVVDWVRHFGDDVQQKDIVRRYLGVYAHPERHVECTTRPFEPRFHTCPTIDAIPGFDVETSPEEFRPLRIATGFVRQPDGTLESIAGTREVLPDGAVQTTSGTRTPNDVITAFMNDRPPEGGYQKVERSQSSWGRSVEQCRPERVFLHRLAWDGHLGIIETALSCEMPPRVIKTEKQVEAELPDSADDELMEADAPK